MIIRSPPGVQRFMIASAGRSGDGQCWRATRPRNSPVGTHLRTMRRSVFLPTRSLTLGRSEPAGGSSAPVQGFGFGWNHPSDQIDSAMPQKTHTGRAPYSSLIGTGAEVAEKDRSQILLDDENTPGLPGRSCGEFPGIGRTWPSRHFPVENYGEQIGVSFGGADGEVIMPLPFSGGVKYFMVAASGAGLDSAAAASRSNSSGVRYPSAECSRSRL